MVWFQWLQKAKGTASVKALQWEQSGRGSRPGKRLEKFQQSVGQVRYYKLRGNCGGSDHDGSMCYCKNFSYSLWIK